MGVPPSAHMEKDAEKVKWKLSETQVVGVSSLDAEKAAAFVM